jgi:hypothetical protein
MIVERYRARDPFPIRSLSPITCKLAQLYQLHHLFHVGLALDDDRPLHPEFWVWGQRLLRAMLP